MNDSDKAPILNLSYIASGGQRRRDSSTQDAIQWPFATAWSMPMTGLESPIGHRVDRLRIVDGHSRHEWSGESAPAWMEHRREMNDAGHSRSIHFQSELKSNCNWMSDSSTPIIAMNARDRSQSHGGLPIARRASIPDDVGLHGSSIRSESNRQSDSPSIESPIGIAGR